MHPRVVLILALVSTLVVPESGAHWTAPMPAPPFPVGTTETHEHPFHPAPGGRAGYHGQRVCDASGALVWSDEDGRCSVGSTPVAYGFGAVPGAPRALQPSGATLGALGSCIDATVPDPNAGYHPGSATDGTFLKSNPHFNTPQHVVVDNGDVSDAFASNTLTNGMLAYPAGLPGAWAGGPGLGDGGQTKSSLAQTPPSYLRFVAFDLPGAGPQASRTVIHGNDVYDASTDPALGPVVGYGYATTRAARASVDSSPGTDRGDNDYETGVGAFCFTYAIDSSPNGWGSMGTGAFPPIQPCQGPYNYSDLVGLTACPAAGGGPYAPPTYGPDGCQFPDAGAALPFDGGCGNGSPPDVPLSWDVFCGAGEDLNDPRENGGPGPYGSLIVGGGAYSGGANEWNAHPIGNDGTFDTGASAVGAFGVCLGNGAAASPLVGNGGAIGAFQTWKGVKLAQVTDQGPAPATLLPIGYIVCNDVAEEGCTNLPIDVSASSSPLDPAYAGHVYASLAECLYDPLRQAANAIDTRAPSTKTPNPHKYYGAGAEWGSLKPSGHPCWPERLCYKPTIGVWAPFSSFASYDPGNPWMRNGPCAAWTPDIAPATARGVEMITGVVGANVRALEGWAVCRTGSDVTGPADGCPDPRARTPDLAPEWAGGWAAVFMN